MIDARRTPELMTFNELYAEVRALRRGIVSLRRENDRFRKRTARRRKEARK